MFKILFGRNWREEKTWKTEVYIEEGSILSGLQYGIMAGSC